MMISSVWALEHAPSVHLNVLFIYSFFHRIQQKVLKHLHRGAPMESMSFLYMYIQYPFTSSPSPHVYPANACSWSTSTVHSAPTNDSRHLYFWYIRLKLIIRYFQPPSRKKTKRTQPQLGIPIRKCHMSVAAHSISSKWSRILFNRYFICQ